MGNITIHFQGICVNFSQSAHPALPVQHRIVLPRVDKHLPLLQNQLIPPHFAALSFPMSDVPPIPPTVPVMEMSGTAILPLTGGVLHVNNPANTSFTLDPITFPLIPNLTTLSEGTIGPPDEEVLFGSNPFAAACWFNVNAGTVGSKDMEGERQTTVEVETDGDPVLMWKPFPSVIWTEIVFPLRSGVTVLVQNSSLNEFNSHFHFLLNYLTAADLPPIMGIPGPPLHDIGGPGCSNSNYP